MVKHIYWNVIKTIMERAHREFVKGDVVNLHLKNGDVQTLLYVETTEHGFLPGKHSHFVMADPDHDHFGKKVTISTKFKKVKDVVKLGNLTKKEWLSLARDRHKLRAKIEDMKEESGLDLFDF